MKKIDKYEVDSVQRTSLLVAQLPSSAQLPLSIKPLHARMHDPFVSFCQFEILK